MVQQNNVSLQDQALHEILDLGEAMILCGIEINQVESHLSNVGTSFGAQRTDVLITPAGLVGTVIFPDGTRATQTRRIKAAIGVNCAMAERLEVLVSDCMENPISVEEFSVRLKECKRKKEPTWTIVLGGFLAMMSFTVLFGGSVVDGLVAGVIGLLVTLGKNKLQRFFPNILIFDIACSFVVGVVVCCVCPLFPILHMDKIMTGALLLMIPGLAFTHATRDVFMGDISIGAMHFIETILWAGGLALGFISAMVMTDVYVELTVGASKDALTIVICLIAAFLGSMGFGFSFRLPKRFLLLTPLCGMIGYSIKLFAGMYCQTIFMPSFLAGFFVAMFAAFMAHKYNTTPMAFAVPGIMPCLPGSLMFYTMSYGVAGEVAASAQFAWQTCEVAIALSAGLCVVWAIEATIEKIQLVRAEKVMES